VDDDHTDVVIGRQRLAAPGQVEHQWEVEEVDRRMVDGDHGDPPSISTRRVSCA
jgi:hypothetical protein